MTNPTFSIESRVIGGSQSPFVIAELGINHGGVPEVAHRMIDAAVASGVDALKLQTFATGRFLARTSPYFDLLRTAELPTESLAGLLEHARRLGATLFSAVFDEESADLWQRIGAPAYKIASCDLTHLPLLRHVARFGKPMLVSSGGATLDEVKTALAAIRAANADTPVAVFHCVSNYPAEPAQLNLACMATMRRELQVPVGFSDHTLGNVAAVAAAALGAELLEKHFTLDRNAEGPDHALSADPAGMKALVDDVRAAFQCIGQPVKAPIESPDTIRAIRRSVTLDCALAAGATISRDMLAVKRPGTGIAPDDIDKVVGRRVRTALDTDTTLTWDLLEPAE